MSAKRQTFVYCDGGKECPLDNEPYSVDYNEGGAGEQRAAYKRSGWLYRGGKDYCYHCAKRLFNHKAKP